ncbi:MAG TPA: MucB/RseB C-terminal domain-containing protein [Steroidobacteraceae bacterium]|nr:MucB/RseB C-terminal domain-containing protein [Steroidobacteraceae bacterium]
MRRPRLLLLAAELLGAAALLWSVAQGAALAAGTDGRPRAGVVGASPEVAVVSADDPRSWLARTDQALATRNYRGVFVHEHAGQTETLRVVQRVGPEGLSERLQSMDGSGREFIRRGNQLLCYLPDRHMVLVERSAGTGLLFGGLPSLTAALAGEYIVTELSRTRVSGRTARVIGIEPRDQLRYGYRVWIDEATAMPLRMQLRDSYGHTLEQIVFTDLVLPAHISAAELAPSVDAHNYRWVQQDVPAPAGANAPGLKIAWQASALPPGFRLTASARQMLPGGAAEHLVFTDGLASVSVFVQARRSNGQPALASSHDDTASLGTSSAYSTAVQGYRITVVGEVPPETVRQIAQAMRTAMPPASVGESSLGVPAAHAVAPAAQAARTLLGGPAIDAHARAEATPLSEPAMPDPAHAGGLYGTSGSLGFGGAGPPLTRFGPGGAHGR